MFILYHYTCVSLEALLLTVYLALETTILYTIHYPHYTYILLTTSMCI